MADVFVTIQTRRTLPMFDANRSVPQELLEKAIEAASWAPNHHLTEPWQFYQLGPETTAGYLDLLYTVIAELKDSTLAQKKFEKGQTVPGWMVVTCANDDSSELELMEDCAAVSCAIQNFALVLWEAGVGMKWSSGPIIRDPRFYELLGIDATREMIMALIPYGYPKLTPEPRPRTPVAEILKMLA